MEESQQKNEKRNKVFGIVAVIAVLISFGAGIYLGSSDYRVFAAVHSVINKQNPSDVKADFALFWRGWNLANTKLPGAEAIPDEEKVHGAIKGMLTAFGDPYTTFFDATENEIFQGEVSGSFSGIGVELGQKNGFLTVIAPLKNTPAYTAGILAGDIILKVDDIVVSDISLDEVITHIRGERGTPVVLTIAREGQEETKEIKIIRDTIEIPTINTAYDAKNDVFKIELYNFSAKSSQFFTGAIREFNESPTKNLIIDLRNNPGGYLDASIEVASIFIPEGDVIVKEIGKSKDDTVNHRSYGVPLLKKEANIVVLVNKGSASASEILAGALQDHKRATIIGEQTFGKGSVQEVVNLPNGTSLKVTIAKWYTPNDISISEKGLTPDIVILNEKEGVDSQLEKAIEFLNKK